MEDSLGGGDRKLGGSHAVGAVESWRKEGDACGQNINFMYVCLYVCMHGWMHVCMHGCMHACVHACVYEIFKK